MEFDLLVYTAVGLSRFDQVHLEESLKKLYRFEHCVFSVDPSLLGGMKLVFRDRIEDYSLSARLRSLRSHLITDGQ